jgi:hypothetical protein
VLLAVVFAVCFFVGWVRSDALTNENQLAAAVSAFAFGGLILTATFMTVEGLITYY